MLGWHPSPYSHLSHGTEPIIRFSSIFGRPLQKTGTRNDSPSIFPMVACRTRPHVSTMPQQQRRKLLIGNLGDGEAVLCRGDDFVHMSPVHNPARPCEKHRIRQANGWITSESVRACMLETFSPCFGTGFFLLVTHGT